MIHRLVLGAVGCTDAVSELRLQLEHQAESQHAHERAHHPRDKASHRKERASARAEGLREGDRHPDARVVRHPFASWGEALKEAGYEPNKKQGKFSSEQVLQKFAEAVRHFGRIPAEIEIRMYTRNRHDFPSHSTFTNHFGNKVGLVAALADWVRKNDDFADLVAFLPEPKEDNVTVQPVEGFVYLLKSGNHFKIGRSEELERRVKQISVALPEEVTLEHAIRTDDPVGIEAYWHRRFAARRAKGEWFQLTVADVRAFKRRKFQ